MKKAPPLNAAAQKALTYIRNRIVHTGRGPSVRELTAELGFRSPRSGALVLERLMAAGLVARKPNGNLQLLRTPLEARDRAQTVAVPLVGSASCGAPMLAAENIEAFVPVSTALASLAHRYFLLRARGDSMTEAGIPDGSLVLVRQQPAAKNGDVVVALIDDEATIKEYHRGGNVVTLQPRSRNPKHRPIILTSNFLVQGVVVATIPGM